VPMLVLADDNPTRHIRQAWVNWTVIVACVVLYFVDPSYTQFGFTPANLHLASGPKGLGWETVALQSVSYAFLHGDIWHLAGNLLIIWIFGNNVEDSMGHVRYALFFVLCAMGGALGEGLFSPMPQVPMIGASGAAAGIMGAYLLLHPRARVLVLVAFRVPVLVPASLFVGLSIALDVVGAAAPVGEGPMVAFWAHLGGFAAGAALILILRYRDVPLFQPAHVYPESAFGGLGRFMIDISPPRGADSGPVRQLLFAIKTLVFFVTITVIAQLVLG
jgi:membrane associated rhomboid family serine protease